MDIRKCKHCNKEFSDVNGKWFSNHVRWCEKNPNRTDTDGIAKASREHFDKKLGLVKEFKVHCSKCNKEFTVEEREKQFPKRKEYFCSRSCSNTRNLTQETKDKIRDGIVLYNGGINKLIEKRICLYCNKEFETKGRVNQRFCSVKCGAASHKSSNEYLAYRHACKFGFNVWDYPEEFDLNLIYKYGWYKPKNRGDNLKGVSRDHKISITFGWENGIDPAIIKHPANCKLMRHNENISKHKKCSIELQQLKESIESWEKKYTLAT